MSIIQISESQTRMIGTIVSEIEKEFSVIRVEIDNLDDGLKNLWVSVVYAERNDDPAYLWKCKLYHLKYDGAIFFHQVIY